MSEGEERGLKRKIEGFLSIVVFPSEGALFFFAGNGKDFIEGEEHRMGALAFDRAFVLWGRRQPPPQEGVCSATPLEYLLRYSWERLKPLPFCPNNFLNHCRLRLKPLPPLVLSNSPEHERQIGPKGQAFPETRTRLSDALDKRRLPALLPSF